MFNKSFIAISIDAYRSVSDQSMDNLIRSFEVFNYWFVLYLAEQPVDFPELPGGCYLRRN